ncbi:MAG: hypothetical protein GY826_08345 [Fuerstiella sp.]|nr:hypothetical protein [Fuerstiella sp.]
MRRNRLRKAAVGGEAIGGRPKSQYRLDFDWHALGGRSVPGNDLPSMVSADSIAFLTELGPVGDS